MKTKRFIRTPIMHRVVHVGELVFVGGTVADDTTRSMGEQTENILQKIESYLGEVELGKEAIVATTVFVTDLSKKAEMDAAWKVFFGDDLPTRATVGVADLGGNALIEVVATAQAD